MDACVEMATIFDLLAGFCGFKVECSRSMADASGTPLQMFFFSSSSCGENGNLWFEHVKVYNFIWVRKLLVTIFA